MGKATKKFGILNLIALIILVAVLMVVPTICFSSFNTEGEIYDSFFGSESELQGVLVVWNIDTFEGAYTSKTDYLENVARLFENNHKGLYVSVKNMTPNEFELKIKTGELPDVISFGFGLGNLVNELLEPLNQANFSEVKAEVLNSGTRENELIAVGYLMGCYCLFSTTEKLVNANATNVDELVLADNILSLSYEKKLKSKVKKVYSLVYGGNYINPLNAVNLSANENILHAESQYDAYVDFISLNKATILLGTQRDLVKLTNKQNLGDISGLKVEPLNGYCDLVQYVGITKGKDELRQKYANYFIRFLCSESGQRLLKDSGMFSTSLSDNYEEGYFEILENSVASVTLIPNAVC